MAAQQDREVLALFDPDADFSGLLAQLQQAGVPRDHIALCSPLPLEQAKPAPRFPLLPYLITIAAGIVGIGVGLFFAAGTAALYPLRTGGKAIVAPPVVGIISYETMMLVAVLATFVTMIVRIVRDQGGAAARDPRIDDGKVAVMIQIESEQLTDGQILRLLEQAGGTDIAIHSTVRRQPRLEEQSRAMAGWMALALLAGALSACSRDMQEQPSYQPQEAPRLHSPTGSVPRDSRKALSAAFVNAAPDGKAGAALFQINCLHCHGLRGEGNGPVAPHLKERPANLLSDEVQHRSRQELYDIITNGKDMMPPFRGELSADERWVVADYVKQGLKNSEDSKATQSLH